MQGIEKVFFLCARAIKRAGLWEPDAHKSAVDLPSAGRILAALSNGSINAERYDQELPERQQKTLY